VNIIANIYSHSKLSSFEQCPLKYKYRYIDKIIPEVEQTIEAFLGGMVHETLEWIYTEVKKGNTPDLDTVIDFYINQWNTCFKKDFKITRTDCDSEYYFNQGIKFVIDYFLANSPFKDNTIELEHRILVPLDKNGTYMIQGFIDRLVHNKETNIFEIHDYKTANTMKTQEELDKDRQLALYSIGIKHSYPNVQEVKLIWHFLAHNKKMISKRSDEELEQLRQDIIDLIIKIENTKEFPPTKSALCNWCEYGTICPTRTNNNGSCQ
jgi:putative RecB family exonuclease